MTVQPTIPERLKGHYVGVLFGAPGVGKTTLAGSAPDPIHIDTGNESLVYAYTEGCQNMRVYKVTSHAEIMEVLMDVRMGKIKCKTVIIDNVSDQIRLQLSHTANKLRQGRNFADTIIPIQQDYGIAFVAVGGMVDDLKDHRFPADVLILAHDREVTSKSGELVALRAGLNPGLAKRVLGAADFCLYMEQNVNSMKGEVTRTIRANPTNTIEAKNRIGLPNTFPAEDLWKMIESRRDN